ncbi:hypothetical protein BCIN_16g04250 [Botrytis cinerea B05.10]|uniref:USP domain-containing protein n=3 Tax=Opisthokonta TaxID=33154 RepID=A0A384K7U3_BOTFB|nr:hypothetical protein BCIN_16g04250 [Botrytis cinerea B05.10]ATZ58724.1 hypothetical protein BCIN_16g04250 [Botrytis cinerea B05.10]
MNKFGGRKDKDKETSHKRDKSRDNKSAEKSNEKKSRSVSDIFTSLFVHIRNSKSEKEQDEDQEKISRIRSLLESDGHNDVKDDQILFCLNSIYANGNVEKAHQILLVFHNSLSGVIYPYDPKITMLGAQNSRGVTCWLDSFLASLFTVPTQFQELLNNFYEDPLKQNLIQLIRLWVNLMRSGILIEVNITERILDSLIECGWDDLDKTKEQDPTEAHMKIGDILDWPMLDLRVDYEHGGIREKDDHRTSKERTLPISISTDHEGPGRLRLEECIERSLLSLVKIQRRVEPDDDDEKPVPEHVETIEAEPNTDKEPTSEHVENTEAEPDTAPPSHIEMIGQSSSQNYLTREVTRDGGSLNRTTSRNSTRKEREVDAFILSKLIRPSSSWSPISCHLNSNIAPLKTVPVLIGDIVWFSKPAPENNREFVERIKQNHNPMLGFDLKRYHNVEGPDGKEILKKNNTHVDIPKKMKLPPHLVHEYEGSNEIAISDCFELVLRSMICHEGSLESGHYRSLIRLDVETGGDSNSVQPKDGQHPPAYVDDCWIVHDDMAKGGRVASVDIDAALKHDSKYGMPVTLWYEFVPILANLSPEDLARFSDNTTPPSYTYSSVPSIDVQISKASPDLNNGSGDDEGYFTPPPNDRSNSVVRFSSEIDRSRRSLNLPDDDRRGSVAATDASSVSVEKSDNDSAPATPGEEPVSARTSRTFRRSKASRSRPQSSSNEKSEKSENRRSYFKDLITRASKESLQKPDTSKESIPAVPALPGLGLDGPPDSSVNGDLAKPVEASGGVSRKGSKKGKRRSKEATDIDAKDKDKNSDHSDRVCNIM